MTKFLSIPLFVGSIIVSSLSFAQGTATSPTKSGTVGTKSSTSTTTPTGKDTMPADTKASNSETGPNRADCSPSDQGKPSQNPNCAGQQNIDPSSVRNAVTPTTPGINSKKGSTPSAGSTQGN